MSKWDIERSDQFTEWYEDLDEATQERLRARIDRVGDIGPTVGRPTVGLVFGSSIPSLREIRSGSVRVLFAFSPLQVMYLILGADKAEHGWKSWYAGAIAEAEVLWAEYLAELRDEGLL